MKRRNKCINILCNHWFFFLVVVVVWVCAFFSLQFIIPFFLANVLNVPSYSICFSFNFKNIQSYFRFFCRAICFPLHQQPSYKHTENILETFDRNSNSCASTKAIHDYNIQLAEFKVPLYNFMVFRAYGIIYQTYYFRILEFMERIFQ